MSPFQLFSIVCYLQLFTRCVLLRISKIHCKADQRKGAFLTQEEAVKKAGESPDHSTRDLFEAIEKGDFPSWTCYIQEMTPEQAESFRLVQLIV